MVKQKMQNGAVGAASHSESNRKKWCRFFAEPLLSPFSLNRASNSNKNKQKFYIVILQPVQQIIHNKLEMTPTPPFENKIRVTVDV
jgi:hypothetical protein